MYLDRYEMKGGTVLNLSLSCSNHIICISGINVVGWYLVKYEKNVNSKYKQRQGSFSVQQNKVLQPIQNVCVYICMGWVDKE